MFEGWPHEQGMQKSSDLWRMQSKTPDYFTYPCQRQSEQTAGNPSQKCTSISSGMWLYWAQRPRLYHFHCASAVEIKERRSWCSRPMPSWTLEVQQLSVPSVSWRSWIYRVQRPMILLHTMGQEKIMESQILTGLEVSNLEVNQFVELPETITQETIPVSSTTSLLSKTLKGGNIERHQDSRIERWCWSFGRD